MQEYTAGSHGTAPAANERLCPAHYGGKNWGPSAYNPELGLLYIPAIEGCNFTTTVEQKDFVDQGGTVKPRERFTGGGVKTTVRLYGSLKAIDPSTGETRPASGLTIRTSAARSRPRKPGLHRPHRRDFSAYDAKTLKELWSFNAGTGINAPPITFSVNGKQYVAVLVGSRQPTITCRTLRSSRIPRRVDAVRVRPVAELRNPGQRKHRRPIGRIVARG